MKSKSKKILQSKSSGLNKKAVTPVDANHQDALTSTIEASDVQGKNSKKCMKVHTKKKITNPNIGSMVFTNSLFQETENCETSIPVLDISLNVENLTESCKNINLNEIEELNETDLEQCKPFSDMAVQCALEDDSKEEEAPESVPEGKKKKKKKKRARLKEKKVEDTVKEEDDECKESDVKETKTSAAKVQENSKKKKKKNREFPQYMSFDKVHKILNETDGENKQYKMGHLRINRKFVNHAYVTLEDEETDILIVGVTDRNRALDRDLVMAKINPEEEWESMANGAKQRTGIVICIIEELHPRKAIGRMKLWKPGVVVFYPKDLRLPLLRIYEQNAIVKEFQQEPELYKDTLYLADIVSWPKPYCAIGKVSRLLGKEGDIEIESKAILLSYDLDITPYKEEIITDLPGPDYIFTELDLKDREDWRNECVFTIDPSTAVDLDDALSCKLLENGNYEIGVHIADVTHFLQFASPIDQEIAKRATTVYMTDNVYHILPKHFCNLCSLLPGRDKLSFSVIFELTPEAEVVKERFAKTIIQSCCQLSYDHAQMIIDDSKNNWPDDFLRIYGDFKISDVADRVNELYKLSVHLRKKRFAGGALRIDQPKIFVLLDKETRLPTSYVIEEQKESNRLIEEFMLLANMTVATHLYSVVPDTALLRNHREPTRRILNAVRDKLANFGVHLDIDSAGDLENSLRRYEMSHDTESEEYKSTTRYKLLAINMLCLKAMSRAMYKCASSVQTKEELWHYGLSVPLYTHFTSPMRRYVDCVVHRLLYSSANDIPLPDNWTSKLCCQIASTCNVKKYNAKLAQEESCNLYFAYLVSLMGPLNFQAVVFEIKGHCMDVILCKVGIKLTIYFKDIKDNATVKHSTDSSIQTVTIEWKEPACTEVINIFTLVNMQLECQNNFRLNAVLLPPPETKTQ